MNIKIRPVEAGEVEAVRQLLCANGWAHRLESPSQFQLLIENSNDALVALADDAIVGFVRAVSDQLSNGYVSMLLVLPGYRRMGIGRTLMKSLIERSTSVTWILRASREGAKEFFSTLGFTPSPDAMELRRL